jgi:hypothetical protein
MAFTEYFADNAVTTLANSVSLIDTSITVNTPENPFPLNFPYRIRIGDEYMLVTSAIGLVWIVTRGEEGSTIATHGIGDTVANVFTVESLMNSAWTYCQAGSRAALPPPDTEFEGRFYFQDNPGLYIRRDDGDAWTAFGTCFELFEPNETGYSWVNQQTATTSTTNGGVVLSSPAPLLAGENLNIRVKTAPVTPYTVKAGFLTTLYPVNQTSAGILFRESGTNKIIFFRLMFDNTTTTKTDLVISVDRYTNSTTLFGNYKVASANIFKSPLFWFSMTDDGVDLTFSYSNNNIDYTQFFQAARSNFLTVGPNQIGYAINSNNVNGNAVLTLLSWKEI